ncbi:MAG: tetratricopeptide repeat protein [Desulfotignum sp.]|jgi:predicted negative regulator of RcsB-dependent stress response|nr:tetratricopeptide repeat protein [Desulfotignum sp.]
MANRGISNERRKELEQLDPLQKNLFKALAYAGIYKKQLLLILGAVVVVAAVFSGIMVSFQRSETQASNLVAEAAGRYNRLADDPQKAFLEVKESFEAVLDRYANTDAGRMAQIIYAGICMDAQEYDRAGTLYENALKSVGNQAAMRNFLLSSLGHVWLAKNDLDRAKTYFQQIETGKSDLLKDESRFILARIYASVEQTDASQKMYEKLVAENQQSMYAGLAQAMVAKEK